MFESLQENLSSAIRTLRGRGRLTESNMREGLALVQTGPAGGRRQHRGRQGFRRQGLRAGRRRDGAQVARPHPPTGRHRPQGTGQPDGPGGPFAAPQAGVDGADALRPARLGQDDHLRQAGQAAPAARPQADARGGRLAAPRGHPAVAGAGPAAWYSRLCRPGRQGSRGPLPDRREAGQGHRRARW